MPIFLAYTNNLSIRIILSYILLWRNVVCSGITF